MIVDKLQAYWTMCVIHRRAENYSDRRKALTHLQNMVGTLPQKILRFVDLKPEVKVRMKGEDEGGTPES